jgi:dTDP-4-dehydrorhamnose 3,5-epimerase
MNKKNIISVHPLKKINLEDGNVLHGLKKSDAGFVDFGEAYFSVVNFDAIKAWKLHQSMTLNLVVPVGKVLFVFFYPSEQIFKEVIIGEENYQRINVPPDIWFGFKGLNQPASVIMNVADMEHNPNEVLRKSINEFKYSW